MKNKRDEFMQMKERAAHLMTKYDWNMRTVRPWSYPMTIAEILHDCDDYDNCTQGSRGQLFSLLKGTLEILEAWEQFELTKVAVIYNGKQVYFTPDMIAILREAGETVEVIEEDAQ